MDLRKYLVQVNRLITPRKISLRSRNRYQPKGNLGVMPENPARCLYLEPLWRYGRIFGTMLVECTGVSRHFLIQNGNIENSVNRWKTNSFAWNSASWCISTHFLWFSWNFSKILKFSPPCVGESNFRILAIWSSARESSQHFILRNTHICKLHPNSFNLSGQTLF